MDDSKKTIVDGKETGGVTKSGNNVHNAQGQFGTKNEGSSSDLSSSLKRASKLTANISDLSNLFAKKAQFNESSMNIMNDIYKKYEQSNLLSIAKTAKSYYCGSSYSFFQLCFRS